MRKSTHRSVGIATGEYRGAGQGENLDHQKDAGDIGSGDSLTLWKRSCM